MESEIRPVDVAIIGGGAAGISAAQWCDDLGLNAVLIEQDNYLGGQLRYIYNPIENYLGVRVANGIEMVSLFEKSAARRNFVRRIGIKAAAIDVEAMTLHLDGFSVQGEKLLCKAIILATGVRRRMLGVPREIDFQGNGVLESGSKDKHLVAGKRVLIVGGGDAAFENAIILSEFADSVRVVYRKREPTARPQFLDAARERKNIELLPLTVVSGIVGNSFIERVELKDSVGRVRLEPIDSILIRIGVEPNSELVKGIVDLDGSGYIKVDHMARTNVPNVYAVGDVANRSSPTLSTAAGTGATAAKVIYETVMQKTGYNTARSKSED